MKKLLNDGLDLNVTAKGQKEAMREDWAADLRRRKPFLLVNVSMPMPIKSFSDSIQSPGSRGLMENMPFCRFSAGLRSPNHLAAISRILFFNGLAAIFAGLELSGFLYQQRFAAKRQGYTSR
jgi:hypothetical protein